MRPALGTALARRGLTLGAAVACGLVSLAAAIVSRNVVPHAPGDGGAAAEFIVTSTRDAGPGTLRDAILAADRLSSRCHILIKAQRIVIDSTLPALINPHGIELEAAAQAGTIDAERQARGPVIEIKSGRSVLTGLHILHAHGYGILINAPGAALNSVSVTDSQVGIMLSANASAAVIRTSLLEHEDTGLMAEPGVGQVTLMSDIFRLNTRAGLWFVGAAQARRGTGDPAAQTPLIRAIDTVFEQNAAGVVLANEATFLQKDRFIDNQSALTVLGGVARVEDSEIRGSVGTAVSVSSGGSVVLTHNMLVDNAAAALIVRDSDIRIEANTFARNGLGVVLIGGPGNSTPLVKDNRITDTRADGLMLIGGAALLQGNQFSGNRGAGLRPLDLVQGQKSLKAQPRLDHNTFHGNGVDVAPTGVYRLTGAS